MKKDRAPTQTAISLKCDEDTNRGHSHLSPALMQMAKRDLEEFKSQSDEAFLIRADMDKKLSSL